MDKKNLGKLEEVKIRSIWEHEQYDFSAWLAEEENINELGSILNLSLTDIQTEQFVGNYRCDILCKDEITGKNVLIENQLEPTNHDHLGKIITYASGLDASVVVWIVETAREEHSSAIAWLNQHTDKDISFFLIEIHAYKIGDSKPAPYFKIMEQPNDFAKQVKSISQDKGELSERHNKRLEFWSRFNEMIETKGNPFNKRKPTTEHWYSVAVGSSKCHISIDLVNKNNQIRVSMYIPDNKDLYDKFYTNKDSIEQMIGFCLNWDRADNSKFSWAYSIIDGLDFDKQDNYKELMEKTIDYVVRFKNAFSIYI